MRLTDCVCKGGPGGILFGNRKTCQFCIDNFSPSEIGLKINYIKAFGNTGKNDNGEFRLDMSINVKISRSRRRDCFTLTELLLNDFDFAQLVAQAVDGAFDTFNLPRNPACRALEAGEYRESAGAGVHHLPRRHHV